MSASSKKKLRKDADIAKLTERQLNEKKEAQKLRAYTTVFVVVLAVLLVVAITFGVNQTITTSGIREKNTTALTLGQHELSNADLNYYYIDTINNFYSTYGSYATMVGLDVTKPLNEQYINEESGYTWADDFLASAQTNARNTMAVVDAANAAGFTLSAEQQAAVDSAIDTMSTYAMLYGYSDAESYLKAMYGHGASVESFKEYYANSALAEAYYADYAANLAYTDADLRAAEAENYHAYSSFSYNYYYVNASDFLEGGTTAEDGTTTYTDEERAAAVAAAEAAAKALTADTITSVAAFDAAVAELGEDATSTAYTDRAYNNISLTIADWLTEEGRKEGNKASLPNITTDAEGNETVNGYYAVYYIGTNDNNFSLANVRRILVTPEHNHENGETHAEGETYSAEELAGAKAAAEELLAQWQSGEATEESFATLANEKSADGDGTTGGLFENVYPGQMVANFNDWCFDEARQAGDTGIVETEYGYHVMYYVSDSAVTYRDYQIENTLRSNATTEWYSALVEAMPMTEGDTKYLSRDLVLSAN